MMDRTMTVFRFPLGDGAYGELIIPRHMGAEEFAIFEGMIAAMKPGIISDVPLPETFTDPKEHANA